MMASGEQVYWEDVAVGSEVPALPKVATTQMLVKWAGASGDFNPLHYDDNSPLVQATRASSSTELSRGSGSFSS